jgi:hypothetical protein
MTEGVILDFGKSGNDAYVDPSDSQGQTRPDYSKSRKQVEKNQFMQPVSGGGFKYQSAFDENKWNYLDDKGREVFSKQAHKGGVIKQQPAMDHVIQYAALNEVYHAIVDHERQKTTQGRTRRNSLDLHDAFKGAVSDPSNLRLVSHDEHVNNGGSKHTG